MWLLEARGPALILHHLQLMNSRNSVRTVGELQKPETVTRAVRSMLVPRNRVPLHDISLTYLFRMKRDMGVS